MSNDTACSTTGCARALWARGLCRSCYETQARAGTLPTKKLGEYHRLTDVDPEAGTATCSTCGPDSPIVAASSPKRRQCRVARNIRRKRTRSRGNEREAEARRRRGIRQRIREELADAAGFDGCQICGATGTMHIDHDHTCCPRGTYCPQCIRGLLCGNCNKGIGLLAEDPQRLAAAITYLASNTRPLTRRK